MISSVIPWQKYSWSFPGLRSTKGSTAIEDDMLRSVEVAAGFAVGAIETSTARRSRRNSVAER